MTVEEGIGNIQELFDLESDLEAILEAFTRVCQDSPLTSGEEDALINEYRGCLVTIKELHSHVVGSYLDWIIATRGA